MSAPTAEEVDRIAVLADPILRNLAITQCYHELSHAVAGMTGSSANWCTFALWASKQAGQSIRREDLIQTFEEELQNSPEGAACLEHVIACARRMNRKAGAFLSRAVSSALGLPDAFGRVADAVARGNQKVFAEIAPEFARFAAAFGDDTVFDAEKAERFCAHLRPGDPPEGQELLRRAFTAYCEARFREDGREKAEQIFYANLLIGFHEQTRLQPLIAEALNVGLESPQQARQCLLALLFPGFWLRIRYHIARLLRRSLPLDVALDRLVIHAMTEARRTLTRCLLTLHLPNAEILRLGTDLRAGFPEALGQIADPRLQDLLLRIDVTPDSLRDSGARDWADFNERMHFITDFFRAYHARPALFDPPFTAEQVAALRAGRLPEGRL